MTATLRVAAALLVLTGCGERVSPPEVRAPRTEPSSSEPLLVVEAVEPDPATEPVPEPELAPEPEPPDPIAELLSLDGSVSTSIGGPNDGRLEGAVALPAEGPGFRSNPRRPNAEAFYGTVELVQALVLAAAVVHEEMPGSILYINDLGFEQGGPIPRHASHRAGRDVDVLFYLLDENGEPREPVGAFLDPRGYGYDFKDLADPDDDVLVRLDVPRTFRFVQALLEGPFGSLVQRIFVAEHIRTLLVEHAERAGVARETLDRFAAITCQPGYPHDDHLHIRFHCTVEDMAAGCEDSLPIYPWRRAELRALRLEPVISRPRPHRPRSRRVTAAEARERAGPMHRRVIEWLDRREAWMAPPRTGRPFCR